MMLSMVSHFDYSRCSLKSYLLLIDKKCDCTQILIGLIILLWFRFISNWNSSRISHRLRSAVGYKICWAFLFRFFCLQIGTLTKRNIWNIKCLVWILIVFLFGFIWNFNGMYWTISNSHQIQMGQRNIYWYYQSFWWQSNLIIIIIINLLMKNRGDSESSQQAYTIISIQSKYVINLIKILLNPYYSELRSNWRK